MIQSSVYSFLVLFIIASQNRVYVHQVQFGTRLAVEIALVELKDPAALDLLVLIYSFSVLYIIASRHTDTIMNYEYYDYEIDGIDSLMEEKECEDVIKQKELISVVKANPPLWDKKQQEYCGKNFNKDLAWASVGAILKMSGSDAEKEFYKIRQRYGKERRKVIMSLKGKSGQSALPTYIPTWELYEMCDTFLGPVFTPRKTSSNYMSAILKPNLNEDTYSPTEFEVVVPQDVKSASYYGNSVSQTFSAKRTQGSSASVSIIFQEIKSWITLLTLM